MDEYEINRNPIVFTDGKFSTGGGVAWKHAPDGAEHPKTHLAKLIWNVVVEQSGELVLESKAECTVKRKDGALMTDEEVAKWLFLLAQDCNSKTAGRLNDLYGYKMIAPDYTLNDARSHIILMRLGSK